MNKRLVSKCNTLIEEARNDNNSILLNKLVENINRNSDLKKAKNSIINAVQLMDEADITVVVTEDDEIYDRIKHFKNVITIFPKNKSTKVKVKEDIPDENDDIEDLTELDEDYTYKDNDIEDKDKMSHYDIGSSKSTFDWYLQSMHNMNNKLLTAEEEYEYIKLAQNGDQHAMNTMIIRNLGLVIKIAKHYFPIAQSNGLEYMDVVQYGNFGLYKAVNKFDLNLGYRFSTYATHWIRQCISKEIAESTTIRLPVHLVEQCRLIYKAKDLLQKELGHEPSDAEVCEYVNSHNMVKITRKNKQLDVDDIKMLTNAYSTSMPISIYQEINTDNDPVYLIDFISDDSDEKLERTINQHALQEEMQKLMSSCLTHRESTVIKLRFGIDTKKPLTLEKVSGIMGVTKERIRQIETKALRKLRRRIVQSHSGLEIYL